MTSQEQAEKLVTELAIENNWLGAVGICKDAIEQIIAERTEACAAIARNHAGVDDCEGGVDCWLRIADDIRALNLPAEINPDSPREPISGGEPWTLAGIVEQLESCGYQCEAGKLENNVVFMALRKLARVE